MNEHTDPRRPDPDPTVLTTQQLWREVGALKELIETRLDAMDQALTVARDNYTRVPTDIDKAIGPLRELFEARLQTIDQRFSGVAQQFQERDTRTTQSEVASKEAIAAALQAAKEAVGEQAKNFTLSIDKSEAATVKQIESIARVGEASNNAAQATISDLKERVTKIESLGIGAATQRVDQQASAGAMWMVIGGCLAIVGLLASIGFGVIALASS